MEYLKLALFNLYCRNNEEPFFDHFWMSELEIIAIANNIKIIGSETDIIVYFDESLSPHIKPLKYLNKNNTLKIFQVSYFAVEYFQYLLRATRDVRFELYHYFLYQLQEMGIKHSSWVFHYTNNQTLEHLVLNLGLSISKIDSRRVDLFIHIKFFQDDTCQLIFFPKKPLWDEGKVCPETEINKILYYLKNINASEYDDITLKETCTT